MADNTHPGLSLVRDEGQVETEGREPIECRNFFNIGKPGSVEGRIQNTQTNPEAQTTTLEITVGKIDVQNKEDQEKVFFKEGDVLKITLKNEKRSMVFSCDHGENHAEGDVEANHLLEIIDNLKEEEQIQLTQTLAINLDELREKAPNTLTRLIAKFSRQCRKATAKVMKPLRNQENNTNESNVPNITEAANNMDKYPMAA